MSKIFDSINVYGSGTTNSSSTFNTYDSGGTTTFTIKDDGNVGIGTSSPNAKLQVLSTSGSADVFRAVSQYGTSLSVTQSGYVIADNGVHIGDINGLSFGSSVPFSKVIITPNDYQLNLGSTIISNDGGYATHFAVDGATLFSNSNRIWRWTDNTAPISFMSLTTTGLAIGTGFNTPTAKLHIKGIDSSSSNYGLKVQDIGGTDNLVVRNDGNVGIGTSSPNATLDIKSPNSAVGSYAIKWFNSGSTRGLTLDNDGSLSLNGRQSIVWGNNYSFTAFDIIAQTSQILNVQGAGSGSVCIGSGVADSGTRLHVKGIDSSSSNYGLKVQDSGGTYNFVVRNDGNVGIGTSTPSETLDVSGKTKTTNFQMTSGATTGYVLTSDINGDASWQSPTGGGNTVDEFYIEPSSTGITWDVSGNSTNYKIVLTANTTINLTNVRNGDYGTLIIEQNGTGGYGITLGNLNGGSTTHLVVDGGSGSLGLTGTANSIDIVSFVYDGTNVYWNKGLNYT